MKFSKIRDIEIYLGNKDLSKPVLKRTKIEIFNNKLNKAEKEYLNIVTYFLLYFNQTKSEKRKMKKDMAHQELQCMTK